MAWIESHQSLLTHRKMLRLEAKLKTDKHKLIGHLHALWWWGLDNADNDGNLREIVPEEIASAAGWPMRKAEEFTSGLVFAGFLDKRGVDFGLHNWRKYAGKLNEKKEKDRNRKKEVAGNSSGNPTEVAEKSQAPTYLPTKPNQPNPPTNPIDALCSRFARFGRVTSGTVPAIEESIEEFSLEWVDKAVTTAAGGSFDGTPSWSYIVSILERWKFQGGPDEPRPSRPRSNSTDGTTAVPVVDNDPDPDDTSIRQPPRRVVQARGAVGGTPGADTAQNGAGVDRDG